MEAYDGDYSKSDHEAEEAKSNRYEPVASAYDQSESFEYVRDYPAHSHNLIRELKKQLTTKDANLKALEAAFASWRSNLSKENSIDWKYVQDTLRNLSTRAANAEIEMREHRANSKSLQSQILSISDKYHQQYAALEEKHKQEIAALKKQFGYDQIEDFGSL